jgi:hypothetical protein
VQLLEDLGESGPLEHALDRDDPRREQAHPLRIEAAGRVLGKDREAFLCFLVAGKTHGE